MNWVLERMELAVRRSKKRKKKKKKKMVRPRLVLHLANVRR
jgi:hypothetical protein